jgi:PAS domain S-box-containing protein
MPRRTIRSRAPAADPLDTLDPAALVTQVRSLLAEAQALSARLAALNEVAVAMQADLDLDAILQALTRQARWVLDFQHCSIALVDGATYRVQVLLGDPEPGHVHARSVQSGAIGRALQGRHALLLHELGEADEAPAGMRSALIMPLRSAGETLGTINFYAHAPRHYTQDDLRIASALTVHLAAILLNVRLFSETTRARDELRTVLESIGDSVLVINAAGRIQLLNSAVRSLLGLPGAELVGRRALWLRRAARVHEQPLLAAAAIRALLGAWQARPAEGASGVFQLSDGRHIEWAYAPLLAAGVDMGGVLTFRDISTRMELEQLREDLLHMLVHDLRTPLSGLIMGLDMLAMPLEILGPQERADMLARTRNAAGQLLGQVNTILDLSKLEAGRLELEPEWVEVSWLLERAHALVLPLARQNQQELLLDVPLELPPIRADERLIHRMIENLLGNALKFTPQAGRVALGARQVAADTIELWVEDSGPGVPEEHRAHIFEKYGQVPGQARRRGTGLGLAFCKLVAEAHAGQIGVRDAPGGGSVFWIRLPV